MTLYNKLKTIYYRIRNPRVYKSDYKTMNNLRRVLDVPCGQGMFISNSPANIVGVDINDIAISKCKQKGYTVLKADAFLLPFQDEFFDAIHCAHLVEHFNPMQVNELLIELNRVLKIGGLLMFRTPLLHKLFYNDPSHIRPYPPSSILSLLNVVPEGDPTIYNQSIKYKFVSINYYHRDLFQFQIETSAAPRKFFFLSLLKIFGKILSIVRIKSIKRSEYSMVLKKS